VARLRGGAPVAQDGAVARRCGSARARDGGTWSNELERGTAAHGREMARRARGSERGAAAVEEETRRRLENSTRNTAVD
jgi:hypothetical protein